MFGLPVREGGRLYNCAAVVYDGEVLGMVPKTYLPNSGEFYEQRQFTSGDCMLRPGEIRVGDVAVPFERRLIFRCRELPAFAVGVELCEDVWTPDPPSRMLCQCGATVKMFIRDRLREAREDDLAYFCDKDALWAAVLEDVFRPVSYTHLSSPTTPPSDSVM